mmetsp:Transcript_66639/g.171535  ORF Transcript_66639/g.171535 Transcript_66639/m.171535 type:complete len:355 (+) Transcript_66639:51-1115(+)|eukprot:CAMPEP_0195059544 /NCGR_PEP_ID=MMETSP0448-20130528/7010_1 /TAXON_ID=66468 /ORGANISM="Heterocapsa triquestra, Strain CCMP 448" /LENGTH=354 /DNA_ID=CAMNT_0040089837 /DNA_START=50 /DNA_END=1114 /DNA_ORIENTATION=-
MVAGVMLSSDRPPFTGWLQWLTSEGIQLQQDRHFNVDYARKVVFHSDGPSPFEDCFQAIPFQDILSVFHVDAAAESAEEAVSSLTLEVISESSEHHGFILKTSKETLKLFCRSQGEAEKWVAALQDARDLARVDCGGFVQDVAGLELMSPKSSDVPLMEWNMAGQPVDMQEMGDEVPRPLQLPGVDLQWAQLGEVRSSAPPDPLSMEPDCTEVTTLSARSRTRITAGAAWGPCDGSAGDFTGSAPVVEQLPRYGDRAEGLTLQQRLQQLDFSDDESEVTGHGTHRSRNVVSDAPLVENNSGGAKVANGHSQRSAVEAALEQPKSEPDGVIVEQCVPFSPPDGRSDDESEAQAQN